MKQQFTGVIQGLPATLDGYAISIGAINRIVKERNALIEDD